MKRILACALSLLLLGGCAAKDVNEYSLFKYQEEDGAPLVVAKTAGNVVPWTMLAAGAILVIPVTIAALFHYEP
ncbi:MAG TPA: hypothetical protein VF950_08095 [Planctomycetota bacterium]